MRPTFWRFPHREDFCLILPSRRLKLVIGVFWKRRMCLEYLATYPRNTPSWKSYITTIGNILEILLGACLKWTSLEAGTLD